MLSIARPEGMNVLDENSGQTTKGCSQEWYPSLWQRLSGCGPTTVANISLYKNYKNHSVPFAKKESLELMQEVWKFVTPTNHGINTTRLLYGGARSYFKHKGWSAAYEVLDVPREKRRRPPVAELLAFVAEGLLMDAPVAFLNLHSGQEKRLDAWHWTTIVSQNDASVELYDAGKSRIGDLALWLETTKTGGGLVYFKL